jgi:hypothetical protein
MQILERISKNSQEKGKILNIIRVKNDIQAPILLEIVKEGIKIPFHETGKALRKG